MGTILITSNESRHSYAGTGLGVHQKLTRSSKSTAGFTFKDTSSTSKDIPKNDRICIALLDPWFQGGTCHILIVQSHPSCCWSTCCRAMIFSKAGLTWGADPQASTRGERLLKLTVFAFRSWRWAVQRSAWACYSCWGAQWALRQCDPAVLVQPASASLPSAAAIPEPLGPRSASGQAVSPPKWTVGKLNHFLGTLGGCGKMLEGCQHLHDLA